MTSTAFRSLPNRFVVNSSSGLKGKYIKIATFGSWYAALIHVSYLCYGNGNWFEATIMFSANDIRRYASGALLGGNLNGISFYKVDVSIYMFIPLNILDSYVYLDAQAGMLYYGTEYEDTIDTSQPITIS